MAKPKTVYVCQSCGREHPKWVGQCQGCQEWNTLVEEVREKPATKSLQTKPQLDTSKNRVPFSRVEAMSGSKQRFSTTVDELDRVLGGEESHRGMVPGAVMLIGGQPGIGKSTLLTQMVVGILRQQGDAAQQPIIYVSGEESPNQIALRINRILEYEHTDSTTGAAKKAKGKPKVSGFAGAEQLEFLTTTNVDEVVAVMADAQPQLVVVDSIQSMTTEDLTGAAGSVGQVRETAERLTTAAKEHAIPLFVVGHVTKEGELAGPKVLEHIVDAVLELSGERRGDIRLLRAIKNRFGATDEVGVFRVREFGYESIANPSKFFIEDTKSSVPGSATICVMEGTRPLLLEVQALVNQSQLAMPRRVGRGIELSRMQVLSAVLQKHCKLPLGTADIFTSIAGGFTVREPAIDLGLAVAIASSHKNKPLPKKTVFIGEIGLLGEVRNVNFYERRVKEAKRLGFETIISKESHGTVRAVLKAFQLL